ncbi:uncharacterized protein KZ484_006797 isoform 2-T2 [Pholidichthys leucotaenia]
MFINRRCSFHELDPSREMADEDRQPHTTVNELKATPSVQDGQGDGPKQTCDGESVEASSPSSAPRDEDSAVNTEKDGSHSQDDAKSPASNSSEESEHTEVAVTAVPTSGKDSIQAPEKQELAEAAAAPSDHTVEKVAPEMLSSPVQDDLVDGPRAGGNKAFPPANTDTKAGAASKKTLSLEENSTPRGATSPQTLLHESMSQGEALFQQKKVQTIGSTEQTPAVYPEDVGIPEGKDTMDLREPDADRSSSDEGLGDDEEVQKEPAGHDTVSKPEVGIGSLLIALGVVVVIASFLVPRLLQPEPPSEKNDMRPADVFLQELEKVKSHFPNQRVDLWSRSRIHIQRHLQTACPTEPVSLILTAGLRAERTLHCLAQDLASAFSTALNGSVLHIDGTSIASQDSDQVKLDIDRMLQGAFDGDKPAAVIHRFEELPPGSTLIFYRYCDHENAAYKKIFLIFTVLLREKDEIPAKTSLSVVEEMVDDQLQKKFLSYGHPVSFDRMDLDKYGGLWSRISHLILPVAAEERIEHRDVNTYSC